MPEGSVHTMRMKWRSSVIVCPTPLMLLHDCFSLASDKNNMIIYNITKIKDVLGGCPYCDSITPAAAVNVAEGETLALVDDSTL